MSDSVTLLMTAIPFPYRGLDKEYNTEMASHHPWPKPWHKSYKSHHISLVHKKHTEWYQKVPLEHCGFECLPFWIYISPIPAWQNLLFKVVLWSTVFKTLQRWMTSWNNEMNVWMFVNQMSYGWLTWLKLTALSDNHSTLSETMKFHQIWRHLNTTSLSHGNIRFTTFSW